MQKQLCFGLWFTVFVFFASQPVVSGQLKSAFENAATSSRSANKTDKGKLSRLDRKHRSSFKTEFEFRKWSKEKVAFVLGDSISQSVFYNISTNPKARSSAFMLELTGGPMWAGLLDLDSSFNKWNLPKFRVNRDELGKSVARYLLVKGGYCDKLYEAIKKKHGERVAAHFRLAIDINFACTCHTGETNKVASLMVNKLKSDVKRSGLDQKYMSEFLKRYNGNFSRQNFFQLCQKTKKNIEYSLEFRNR